MSIENPLSNYSYINKDFNAVWEELLSSARKLSAKWDPVASNESDPGVVLIKLISLLADKCNYNIDANMLELYPSTVAQSANAREIFESMGYSMKWYLSSYGNINISFTGDTTSVPDYVTIPRFTMVSNSDDTIIYTIIEEKDLSLTDTSTKSTSFSVMQGIITDYTLLGETRITVEMLDSHRRLYFTENMIAENGIFITDAESSSWDEWTRVDNLNTKDPNSKVYKFGVDKNNNCYIEFPSDIASIIPDGIYIKYLQTMGESGNVSYNVIEKFYANPSIEYEDDTETTQTLTLDTSNTTIAHKNVIKNGKNPESIEDAFENYQKTIGVFETLVSLRDYTDYIYTVTNSNETPLVSNDIVADRTNDIQSSYKLYTLSDDVESLKTITALKPTTTNSHTLDEYEMTPYNLKLYLLNYVSNPGASADNYNSTFVLLNNNESYNEPDEKDSSVITTIYSLIDDIKSVQHDFIKIKNNTPCLFINKYPVKITIIPKYKLTTVQSLEIKQNIYKALYNNFNSRKMSFGEEASYDDIYDIITESDERIKSVILDQLEYTTYVYFYSTWGDYCYFTEDGEQEEFNDDATTKVYCGWNLIPFHINTKIKQSEDTYRNFGIDCYAKSVLAGNSSLFGENTTYHFLLNQQKERDEIESINKITSSVDITLTSDTEYTLKDNENIFIQRPNYEVTQTYSTDVRFEYYFPNASSTIASGTDYKLTGDDYLICYWLANEDDERFQYQIFKSGNIITPNGFDMDKTKVHAIASTEQKSNTPLLDNWSAMDTNGTVIDASINNILSNYSQYKTETTPTRTNEGAQLSSNRTINKNEARLTQFTKTSNKYYYWYLNKTTNSNGTEVYRLFEEDDDSTVYTQSYQLQVNEYFYVASEDLSDLRLYGSGTKIVRTRKEGSSTFTDWEVPTTIDITNLSEIGLDAIITDWETISSTDITVTAKEMKFIALGQGAIIKSLHAYSLNSEAQALEKGSTGAIQYKSSSDETSFTTITQMEVSEPLENGWSIFTKLNLNITEDTPQTLYAGHKMIFKSSESGVSDITITGNNSNPIIIQSSLDITASGGENIDVSYTDTYKDTTTYANFYVYKEDEDQVANNFIIKDFTTKINFLKVDGAIEHDRELKFNLPSGHYIIPIYIGSNSLGTLKLKLNPVETVESITTGMRCLNDGLGKYKSELTFTDPTKGTIKYIDMIYANTSITTLTVSIDESVTEAKSVTIQKIKEYVEVEYEGYYPCEELGEKDFYEAVFERMQELDYNKQFNYSHQIDTDSYIADPLKPINFLNENHVFNKFTICQINTQSTNIYITNNIK